MIEKNLINKFLFINISVTTLMLICYYLRAIVPIKKFEMMPKLWNYNSKHMCIGITTWSDIKVACLNLKNSRRKNMFAIGNVNGCYTRDSGWQNFHPRWNGSKSFTAFPPWKSAIGGNGGRPRSADYYWQLKSDDTCKRKSNGEVFSMCTGPQFGRVKSRRITVGKSLTIFTSILSRRGKPGIAANLRGCAFHINKRWICTLAFRE